MVDRREDFLCRRLENLEAVLDRLARSAIIGSTQDRLLSGANRWFRALGALLKLRLAAAAAAAKKKANTVLRPGLRRLLGRKKDLTIHLHDFVFHVHSLNTKATKQALSRQTRTIPDLIFAMEQTDATLLKLAKATRTLESVGRWVYRGQARDFKLNMADVKNLQREAERCANKRKKPAANDNKDSGGGKPKKKKKKAAAADGSGGDAAAGIASKRRKKTRASEGMSAAAVARASSFSVHNSEAEEDDAEENELEIDAAQEDGGSSARCDAAGGCGDGGRRCNESEVGDRNDEDEEDQEGKE
ncbi:unnamed protein product, partial [Phaeothamnion confervicola]